MAAQFSGSRPAASRRDLSTKISLSSHHTPSSHSSSFTSRANSSSNKRPHSVFKYRDDDNDDEDDEDGSSRKEITSFGGDSPSEISNARRTIEPLADTRVWGTRAKRQKSNLPQQAEVASVAPVAPEEPQKHGLQFPVERRATTPENKDSEAPAVEVAPPTEEDEAFARLAGKASGTQRTIPSETEAFSRDVATASADPTFEDYEATPIEGFGAALMRGYLPPGETIESWKAKSAAKRRVGAGSKRVDKDGNMTMERRSDLLGLGAKEMDLGKEGSDKKQHSRRQNMEYEPLARRNVHTGEIIGEHEYRENVEREEGEGTKSSDRPRNHARLGTSNTRSEEGERPRSSDRPRSYARLETSSMRREERKERHRHRHRH